MSKTTKPLLLTFAVLWLIALGLATVYDLDISLYIADPMSPFGRTLEIIGEPPAILFASFNCGLILACFMKKPGRGRRELLLAVLAFIGMVGAAFYTIHETFNYIAAWITDARGEAFDFGVWGLLAAILITVIVCTAMLRFVMSLSRETLERHFSVACRCVFAAITTLAVIWCFKLGWGRVRFRQLDGDLTRFTRWYLPQGYTGYFSFPSGHTANAAVIFTSVYYLPFLREKNAKADAVLLTLLSIWVALLAFSRVRVGAHYLSDVLFGAAITFAIVWFWRPRNHNN
ncbi:MAG: phosphatase PAP2 family protein [Clostridia bacterium]|nr:phosphatase PAP2 family protein [Clostridia bacterium]